MLRFLNFRVFEVMSTPPVTVSPETPLADVGKIFEEHDFNGMPVVDASGCMVGFVSQFDILKAFTLSTRSIIPPYHETMSKVVGDVMTREPVSVDPDLPLTRVLQKMVEIRTTGFPVVAGQRAVGIITRKDVIRALHRAATEEA